LEGFLAPEIKDHIFYSYYFLIMAKGDKLYTKALKLAQSSDPDISMIKSLLEKSIKKGNSNAEYALSTWYLHGENVPQDLKKAISLLERASNNDNPNALYDLAICYEKGVGTDQNFKKAFDLYLRGSFNGDEQCYYEVGRCYFHGIGVKANKRLANLWLDHAEKLGIIANDED
jgi:TPR repeat protein